MDAPNSNRLKSGIIVALYILSLFVVAATPTAMAQEGNPEVHIEHGEYTDTACSVQDTNVLEIISGNSEFGEVVDLVFSNISSTAYSGYSGLDRLELHTPGAGDDAVTTSPYATFQLSDDGGEWTGTASGIDLTEVGEWEIEGFDGGTQIIDTCFVVEASKDFNVQINKDTSTWNGVAGTKVNIKVTYKSNGTPVKGAVVALFEKGESPVKDTGEGLVYLSNPTPSTGTLTWNQPFPGAGDFLFVAMKNASGTPATWGSAEHTVTSAGLDVEASSGSAIQDFTRNLTYWIGYPTSSDASPLDSSSRSNNFTIWLKKDGSVIATAMCSVPFTAPCESTEFLDSNGTIWDDPSFQTTGEEEVISVNATGNVTLHNKWASGTYTLVIHVDNGDFGTNMDFDNRMRPEYVMMESFSPSAPAPVTITVDKDEVDVPARTHPPGTAPNETFTISVVGPHEDAFPDESVFGKDNITIEGDFVENVNDDFSFSKGTLGDGVYTITDITPAVGGGEITITVDWNGEVSHTVNIVDGALITSDTNQLTVDTPTDVTFHVEDVFGNAIPDGQVVVFHPDTGKLIASLNGTGAPGKGQGGNYDFTLNITSVKKVYAHAIIGEGELNYTYTSLQVVPAHDVRTSVSPSTLLAGEETTLDVNVTRNGPPYGATLDVYLLNQSQFEDFQEDNEIPTSAVSLSETAVSTGNYTLTQNLAAGTYHLYVVSTDGEHDNAGFTTTVTVEPASSVVSPSVLVKTVDKNSTIDVTVTGLDGENLDGTLAVVSTNITVKATLANGTFVRASENAGVTGPTKSDTHLRADEIPVTNGSAEIPWVNTTRNGMVWLFFQPDTTGSSFALLSNHLEVQPPNIAVAPEDIFVGETNRITVTVTHPATGAAISGATVTVQTTKTCGGSELGTGTTDANGRMVTSVFPTSSSKLYVCVNGDNAGSFTPVSGLSIEFEQTEVTVGDTVKMTVRPRGSSGTVQGATVMVDGSTVGTTGLDGTLTLGPFNSEGTVTVKVTKQDFANASADLTVTAAPVAGPDCTPVELSVSNVQISGVEEGKALRVDKSYIVSGTVSLASPTDERCDDVTVQIKFQQNGVTTQVQQLVLGPGDSEDVGFTWTPSQSGEITVGINGVTRTINVKALSEDPTVPGFSTLAAFGALGAALVLLKQRRRFD